MSFLVDPEVEERVNQLDLPFNKFGFDPLGVSRQHLIWFHSLLAWMYRNYFQVTSHDIQNVPDHGRVMLIANHSGGIPVDAGMILSSLLLDHNPPRHVHGMVEKFAQKWPVVSMWFNRIGQLTGLPEHAIRLLETDRALMVFPEGVRGVGKLYKQRYTLQRFGTGFMRLALQTGTPIVPVGFVGGEETLKVMHNSEFLAKLSGSPTWPVPKHILPIPLPVACDAYFGKPLVFEGDGTESDEVIEGYVQDVRKEIYLLLGRGLVERGEKLPPEVQGVMDQHAGGRS